MCTPPVAEQVQPKTHRLSRRLRRQRVSSIVLDTTTASIVLRYLYTNPSYLNPWKLPNIQLWVAGFLLIRFGVLFYDHLVVLLIEKLFKSKVLPTREPGAPPVRCVSLDKISLVYLFLNSFNEYAFVMRLTHYLWQGGHQQQLPWKLSQLTLGNTIIALGIMFVSMDFLYAPLHHMLHLPKLYPLIHKHHHRQHFPTRGYLDAGNEHPIEHMIGVMCTWFAVLASEMVLPTVGVWLGRAKGIESRVTFNDGHAWIEGGGVHALTVILFFQFHAALACLNHSPYDVNFSLPFVGSASLFGLENKVLQWINEMSYAGKWLNKVVTGQWFNYSVGHHEMHHRKFNYNYGQYCMFYDKWMGTFLEYEGPMSAAELEARKNSKSKSK